MSKRIRFILKRVIQPPIDTPAGIEHMTIDMNVNDVEFNWIMGKDNTSCYVSTTAVGMEILKEAA